MQLVQEAEERSMRNERQATPHAELIQQIMDSRVPKNEREWAAGREIEHLRAEVASLERIIASWKREEAEWIADEERLRGIVASQLESIQNLGTAPHCPTCECRADQQSGAQHE
jgi:hypothetical protein